MRTQNSLFSQPFARARAGLGFGGGAASRARSVRRAARDAPPGRSAALVAGRRRRRRRLAARPAPRTHHRHRHRHPSRARGHLHGARHAFPLHRVQLATHSYRIVFALHYP